MCNFSWPVFLFHQHRRSVFLSLLLLQNEDMLLIYMKSSLLKTFVTYLFTSDWHNTSFNRYKDSKKKKKILTTKCDEAKPDVAF